MTTVCPGLTVTGAKLPKTEGSSDASQMSPGALVTAGSKAFVVELSDMFTNPPSAGPEYGPISAGMAPQKPGCTVPPPGVYEPAALLGVVGGPKTSGSPGNGLKSNSTGSVAVAAACTLDVCVGTNQYGAAVSEVEPSGSAYPLLLAGGANCANARLVGVLRRASMKNASGAAPSLVIVTGMVTGTPAGKSVA